MLVLLPLYAFYIAYVLDRVQNIFTYNLFRLTLWWGCFYNVLAMLTLTRYGFNTERGRNLTLFPLRMANFDLAVYFPSVFQPHQGLLFAVWIGLYAVITGLLVFLAWHKNTSAGADYADEPFK